MNISLGWDKDAMVVGLEIVGLPDSELDALSAQCGEYHSLWFINRDRLVLEEKGDDSIRAKLAFNKDGYILRIAFPREIWRDRSGRDRPIPLLIAANRKAYGRLGVGTTGKTVSATLVPISVVKV